MKITDEMIDSFQRGSGYGHEISADDVRAGLTAALAAIEVTDHMIYAYAGEPEITGADAHVIEQGLKAVFRS